VARAKGEIKNETVFFERLALSTLELNISFCVVKRANAL
jgi:hypothetical protein